VIVVVGATGALGGRVVRQLLDRAQQVRALVRSEAANRELQALGAETVRGDLTDPDSLRPACVGADTVVATATAIARRLSGAGGPDLREVDDTGMAALVTAAQDAGVGRFVYVSYAGVDAGLGFPLERAKRANEERLRASSLRTTIVRPDAFQEVHLGALGRFDVRAGKVSVFGKGDTKHRWVSTDDVAALIALLAVEPDPPEIVEFGGPEAISRNQAIAVAEAATGRTMKVQRMPLPVARLAMRLLGGRNAALASVIGTGVLMDTVPCHWDDAPLRARGIAPRSASDFITAQAGAATP
jgi:uncharacterized protein YbjT (DUF2867 family)